MPYIERILRESDTFEHEVRALRPAQQDELRIGSYTSISKNWLPQVIRGFSRKYPGVRPYISAIATQDSAVIKMGEQGLGGSILSELVLRGNTDHVSLAPLDPPAWRQLGAGVKSLNTIRRVTKNFLNYIQNGKAQKRPRRSFRRGRFIYACSRLRSQRLGSPAHGITAATRPDTAGGEPPPRRAGSRRRRASPSRSSVRCRRRPCRRSNGSRGSGSRTGAACWRRP